MMGAWATGRSAVALALQDTLSNLFAGVRILTSRKVQPGDFIQLDNGMEGYVEDTNWRNTLLRQLPNNLLVTNYHLLEHEVKGGVPEHEPTVRYNTFGDSSICFNVGLRAADVSAQALITHEFIKRLHSRYQREGIDNSSPTETVVRQEPEPLALLRVHPD
jgi:small-conductance mechanosensitive channel